VTGYAGIEGSVLTYPKERIDDVLKTPDGVEGKDLTVRVFGFNSDTLRDTANNVRDEIAKVDGTEAPTVEVPVLEPTLKVEVDLDKAQALGIKPGDVRRAAATVLSGIEVGSLFEEQKIFEVVVWGTPETRHSLENVQKLKIDRPDGAGQVTLDEVADVTLTPSPTVIKHEGTSRSIDVGIDVSGRDIDAVASDIEDRIRAIDYPIEYHAEVLGDYQDRQSARLTFIGVSVAAAVGIFLILQAAFASWRMASVLFVALPGALTGGVIAAAINGGDVTIGTFAGFLVVFALAARHSLVLVRHSQQLEDGGEAFGPDLVKHAVGDRLAPTLSSAVASLALFAPLLFFGGRAGFEVVHPMAVVVVGGLVTSMALTLLVAPSLYRRFGLRREGSREPLDLVIDLTTPEPPAETVRTPSTVDA
jgi:Cu/Ag efflux pump CusA